MENTIDNSQLIKNLYSDNWKVEKSNPYDEITLFIKPNKYYYFKFHVKVVHDPLNILPKKIKIVLDNTSLQLKKKKKIYCYIPYTEIQAWKADPCTNTWIFLLHDSCNLIRNSTDTKDTLFVFKTKQHLKISQTIHSFTQHLANEIQFKQDRIAIRENED